MMKAAKTKRSNKTVKLILKSSMHIIYIYISSKMKLNSGLGILTTQDNGMTSSDAGKEGLFLFQMCLLLKT